MKNTKAIFLIILGSFILATGFAFAVESETYNDLVKNGAWGTRSGTEQLGVAAGSPAPNAPSASPAPAPAPAPTPTTVVPAPTAKPEEKPTFGENMKKFLGKHMATMAMVGIGAYVGFALMGPAGILMGALFMYAFTYLGNL